MRAYLVDVGVLLSGNCEEFDKYSKVYDEQYGYFDESQFYVKDKAEALKQAREYVKNGVKTTYAVVSETNIPYDYDFEEGIVEGEAYHPADVVYSAAKINDAIVEDFVAHRKFILEKSFLEECYELYKIDWCTRHGVKPEDIDEEIGIFGECYVCLAEFEQNEFQDKEYINSLLSLTPPLQLTKKANLANTIADAEARRTHTLTSPHTTGGDMAPEATPER